MPLRPGALFVVGDPKQSIYRFRRADIDIYNIVRERFSDPAVGRVLPLTMNFRSVPALCDWANNVFETPFPARADGARAPVCAARSEADEDRVAADVFTLTHTCDDARTCRPRMRQDRDATSDPKSMPAGGSSAIS